jgi:signal peptidase I
MVELYGSITSAELVPLVRFLGGLHKSGQLLVAHGHWSGQLSFDSGQLVAATFEDGRGRMALEFIAGALRDAQFEFCERPASDPPDLDLGADPVALLEQFTATPHAVLAELPGPHVVPRQCAQPDSDAREVTLLRSDVALLLRIDGRRDIEAISSGLGLLRTLYGLERLHQLGFIEFEIPAPTAAPVGTKRAPGQTSSAGLGLRSRLGHLRAQAGQLGALRVGSELLQAVVFTAVLVLGIRALVLNFRVEGISMQPTFESGEVLLVNRAAYFHVDWKPLADLLPTRAQGSVSYLFGGPQRGDVVIFHSPVQPGTDYIKRIIGLPGDRVAVGNGTVFVNDAALTESFIHVPPDYRFPDSGSAVVPDDSYFVLGDNRPESLDSHFGWYVPVDDLVGRAWLRYWPPDELEVVQSPRLAEASASTDLLTR